MSHVVFLLDLKKVLCPGSKNLITLESMSARLSGESKTVLVGEGVILYLMSCSGRSARIMPNFVSSLLSPSTNRA
jgi:hypothetical protein